MPDNNCPPRLDDAFVVVRLGLGRFRFVSARRTVDVAAPTGFEDELERLVASLEDGTTPLDHAQDTTTRMMMELVRQGLVTRSPPLNGSDPQNRFLANFRRYDAEPTDDAPNGQPVDARALIDSTVVVVGLGRLGGVLLSTLARLGVSQVKGWDVADPLGDVDLAGADLLVVCTDRADPALCLRANEMALDTGTPWISACDVGTSVELGPLVVPGESACYRCLELRRASNIAGWARIRETRQLLADQRADLGHLHLPVAADLLAMEVAKVLTKFSRPITYETLVVFDYLELSLVAHPILRVPRCPACSRLTRSAQPTPSLWNLGVLEHRS